MAMTDEYTPRRAGKRWLDGAPNYILDVFDDRGHGDRYTVLFTKALSPSTGDFADTSIAYLGMSGAPTHPQGISMWGEMTAYQAVQYRYSNGHRRIKWSALPENIRAHVIARATAD
jgi:hypothetical protein